MSEHFHYDAQILHVLVKCALALVQPRRQLVPLGVLTSKQILCRYYINVILVLSITALFAQELLTLLTVHIGEHVRMIGALSAHFHFRHDPVHEIQFLLH